MPATADFGNSATADLYTEAVLLVSESDPEIDCANLLFRRHTRFSGSIKAAKHSFIIFTRLMSSFSLRVSKCDMQFSAMVAKTKKIRQITYIWVDLQEIFDLLAGSLI